MELSVANRYPNEVTLRGARNTNTINYGAGEGIRTLDLRFTKPLLYH